MQIFYDQKQNATILSNLIDICDPRITLSGNILVYLGLVLMIGNIPYTKVISTDY